MVPNLVSALAADSVPDVGPGVIPDVVPDWEGDSAGCCAAGAELRAQLAPLGQNKSDAASRESEVAVTAGSCRAALGLDGRGRPSPHEQAPPKFRRVKHQSLRVR